MLKITCKNSPLNALLFLSLICVCGCTVFHKNPFIYGIQTETFTPVGPLKIYHRYAIFEYLNGEAEQYLSTGFKTLYSQSYRMKQRDMGVLIDAYDMSSSNQAQKIFNNYTMDEGNFINGLGEMAWTDNYIVLIKKGAFFIRLWSDPSQETSTEPYSKDLLQLGREIDEFLVDP